MEKHIVWKLKNEKRKENLNFYLIEEVWTLSNVEIVWARETWISQAFNLNFTWFFYSRLRDIFRSKVALNTVSLHECVRYRKFYFLRKIHRIQNSLPLKNIKKIKVLPFSFVNCLIEIFVYLVFAAFPSFAYFYIILVVLSFSPNIAQSYHYIA